MKGNTMAKKETGKPAGSTEMTVPDYVGSLTAPGDVRPDWMTGKGRGNENVRAEDVAIPRLEIIQVLSPIREDNPDAEGQLYNSVTGEIYGDSVLFVPVVFVKQYLVWKERKAGGGFRGAFATEEEAKNRIRELVEEGENAKNFTVTDTPSHFGLIVGANGELSEIVISMPKSKQKVSRKFNAAVNLGGGDRFSRLYEFGVFKDRNSTNDEYYNLMFKMVGFVNQQVYAAAEACYEKVVRGFINIAHDSVAGDDESAGGSAPADTEI